MSEFEELMWLLQLAFLAKDTRAAMAIVVFFLYFAIKMWLLIPVYFVEFGSKEIL